MKKEYPDILKLEGEKWHNPDPATGKLGTRVPAEWLQTTEDSLKSLTLEMLEVLKAAGINPNELNNTQVRDAIQKMILEKAGTPSTITASTKNSVTESNHTHEIDKATTLRAGIVQLTNTIDTSQDKAITPFAVNELQKAIEQAITEATEVPVDKIFAFDTATPPKGYIARNGQAIDRNTMPKLYARYGANMPDDRDRVLRMAGPLAGSAGSTQEDAMQKITGRWNGGYQNMPSFGSTVINQDKVYNESGELVSGIYIKNTETLAQQFDSYYLDSSRETRVATETRAKSRIVILCNKIQ